MSIFHRLITPLVALSLCCAAPLAVAADTTSDKAKTTKQESKAKKDKPKKSHKADKLKKKTLKYSSVNINSASAEEIMLSLKGVGKKKAKAIVDYRKKNGKFNTIDDLMKVKGIGKKLIAKNKKRVRFSGKNVLE
ncbi:MAG: ComEA family DNA-binding protein [Psychrobium sp.]